MNQFNRNKVVILTFLLLPSLLWVIWSFKMNEGLFRTLSKNTDFQSTKQFQGSSFLEHTENTILGSGVCPLGKFGAFVTFIWSMTMITACFWKYGDIHATDDEIVTFNKVIASINISIVGIIFVLSVIMNLPLFIRTLPYFMMQIAITILILTNS
jgi:hypothetical protein